MNNITLEQILDNPEIIKAIPDSELAVLLSQYYPAVRTPVLPEGKSKKLSNMELQMLDVLKDNKDLIERIRQQRNK